MNKVRKIFNRNTWEVAVVVFILIQPIIDLDYLWYEQLNQLGLPRLSTIIRFLVLPCLILWGYFYQTKNKKKTAILAISYGMIFAVYYILHSIQAIELYDVMGFTRNFQFSWYQELVYLLTLTLPLGTVYCITQLKPNEKLIKKVTMITSAIVSFPIFIANLFVFGYSTYQGNAVANFFVWFTQNKFHPRQLATKFFFAEGNTVGILLFMLLPLMYYFFSCSKTKKEKAQWIVLIFIQSLAMQILGTRVATYGAVLVPCYFLVLYLIDVILKNQTFKKAAFFLPIVMASIFALILPYTPAVLNQKLDATNDVAIINSKLSDEISDLKGNMEGEGLVPGTVEYNEFFIYMFEEYGIRAGYINTVPVTYYINWYHYTYDPVFWVDVIEMDVYDRLNGRQIQRIFMDYKLESLQATDHLLGAGYSTFMNGSILLEQDFLQQWMTLGIIGFSITLLPWIVLTLLLLWKILTKWKLYLRLEVFVYGAALLSGFGVGWLSGHTMDQFLTTTWLAFIMGILLNKLILERGK